MENQKNIFAELQSLVSSKYLFKDGISLKFENLIKHIEREINNPKTRFVSSEYDLYVTLKRFLNDKSSSSLNRIYEYLFRIYRENMKLAKNLLSKFELKAERIFLHHKNDVEEVEIFFVETSQFLKRKIMVFYLHENNQNKWMQSDFHHTMLSYLFYQYRLNPNILTDSYINNLKGHYAFVGLGLQDRVKVNAVNYYYQQHGNPFNIDISKVSKDDLDAHQTLKNVILQMRANEDYLGYLSNEVLKFYQHETNHN
jgi:rRNA maturation protein Rpf1